MANIMKKSPITTHILDLAKGRAAAGVPVLLEKQDGSSWKEVSRGQTNADGRVEELLPPGSSAAAGVYRMTFDTKKYFEGGTTFYPYVSIVFDLSAPTEHYHIPLLLSPFGYSTYRGT
jgi:5-hydroxyisourate hydrolase